jgi:predicted nucleic acid-binding protein
MITAVDSSVLIDAMTDDPRYADAALQALQEAGGAGVLTACPVTWAEVQGLFEDAAHMQETFNEVGIRFDPFDLGCADLAGTLWHQYRRAGGTRARLIADFLIGAHAQLRAQRLLTRDRGFYRRYFSELDILEPELDSG